MTAFSIARLYRAVKDGVGLIQFMGSISDFSRLHFTDIREFVLVRLGMGDNL